MFSRAEKNRIAAAVEQVIRDINHPEMDNDNIHFQLHVSGREPWSYADIKENSPDNTVGSDPNPWNEVARRIIPTD